MSGINQKRQLDTCATCGYVAAARSHVVAGIRPCPDCGFPLIRGWWGLTPHIALDDSEAPLPELEQT